jgi:hypothetical protein
VVVGSTVFLVKTDADFLAGGKMGLDFLGGDDRVVGAGLDASSLFKLAVCAVVVVVVVSTFLGR